MCRAGTGGGGLDAGLSPSTWQAARVSLIKLTDYILNTLRVAIEPTRKIPQRARLPTMLECLGCLAVPLRLDWVPLRLRCFLVRDSFRIDLLHFLGELNQTAYTVQPGRLGLSRASLDYELLKD
jgi:hypothetical protein